MSRRVIVEDRHTGDAWIWLVILAVIVIHASQIIIAGACLLAVYLLLKYLQKREQTKAQKMVEAASTFDPIYSYETMPLTYPICDTFPYQDVDDGLRGWK